MWKIVMVSALLSSAAAAQEAPNALIVNDGGSVGGGNFDGDRGSADWLVCFRGTDIGWITVHGAPFAPDPSSPAGWKCEK